MEGDIFKNPDLAKAYRLISEQGSDVFYKGEIAESIVSSLRNTGSKITMEDLADYKVIVKEPYTTTYHGYNIAIAPPMCAGTVTLASLNLAEHFDMGSIEFGSKDYIHLWSEIFRLAWADYATALEDPDFYDLSKARGMITKEYADERYKLIDMKKSMGDGPVGKPENYDPESHTTHLSVIDSEGNMVSMTNTNSEFFGTMTTAEGYGFIIQDTNVFSAKFSSFFPEPGKRPRTTIAPILITNSDGSPYAAIGTPGSQRILTTDAMIINNLIDYGVSLEEAVNRPKLYQNRTTNLFLEGGFDESLEEELTAMGHKITWRGANDSYFGGAHCVMIDPETGDKVGCADIRRDGAAIGY